VASQQIHAPDPSTLFLGELSLDGGLRHTAGILPMVSVAKDQGIATVFVPASDAAEAALVEGIRILPAATLGDVISHLRDEKAILPYTCVRPTFDEDHVYAVDLAYVKGQEHVKRALEVAAAGGHNLLLSGPPGAGKTLLARALPSVMPRLSGGEALEVTKNQ